MFASLRGASSTEDTAKAATNASHSCSDRFFPAQSLRSRSENTRIPSPTPSPRTPISIKGKRSSVSDLVGKFETQDSGSETAPKLPLRAATTPSPQLRSVYRSISSRDSGQTQKSNQRPPRRRLISDETIYEAARLFTSEQVSAATSFTTPKYYSRNSVANLKEAPGGGSVRVYTNSTVQTFKYEDQATQVPDYNDQASQAEHEYKDSFAQASLVCQDQASQTAVSYHDRSTQITSRYQDHSVQAKPTVRKSSIRFADYEHIVVDSDIQSQNSAKLALFTARNCSGVSQPRGNAGPDVGVSLESNAISIEFPQGTKIHMLQRIRGGKIVLDPAALPCADSSEASAQGVVYTPGYVREEEPKASIKSEVPDAAPQRSPSTSCSSCSAESCCSSGEDEQVFPLKVVPRASGSHYTEAKSLFTSPSNSGPVPPNNSETAPLITGDLYTREIQPAGINELRKSSSTSHFEPVDEVRWQALTRPQTLARFRSIPLIRVQRPSTDSEMVLATRVVKPIRSATPVVPIPGIATEIPALPVENLALPDSSPTTSTAGRKHLRQRMKDRRSKQITLVDVTNGKVGVRARLKRSGSNIGRKGRKKFIFRKKIMRILLGKELAETISQTLQTTGNGAGAADATHDVLLVTPLPVPPTRPTQIDGADADVLHAIPAFDCSHKKRQAARRAKKELKRQQEYEQLTINVDALLSTPCLKCGGQQAYLLNVVYEYKKKMLKHDKPKMKRRDKREEAKRYVENIECRCPRGTSTAGSGAHDSVSKARKITPSPKIRTASQRACGGYDRGGDVFVAPVVAACAGGAAIICLGAAGC